MAKSIEVATKIHFVSFVDLCEKILSEAVLIRQVEKLLGQMIFIMSFGSTILHLAELI